MTKTPILPDNDWFPSKGGTNPPNDSEQRPPAPGGSGGKLKKICVEIGVPSQIEPGQEVEVENVPVIRVGDTVYVGNQKGVVLPAGESGEVVKLGVTSDAPH